jgi:hypothetical protein
MPYRDNDAPPPPMMAIQPLDFLRQLELHDPIAHAALTMMRNGAPDHVAITAALQAYARSNAEYRRMLTRAAERMDVLAFAKLTAE